VEAREARQTGGGGEETDPRDQEARPRKKEEARESIASQTLQTKKGGQMEKGGRGPLGPKLPASLKLKDSRSLRSELVGEPRAGGGGGLLW
jgi:hypothetical protein